MRAGSLCAGYGGLDLAVEAVLGGEVTWVAEIDPDASRVLACRFPDAPNYGDISKVNWSTVEPVDILTAGFPCQDVSCAGARKGLRAGTRTGVWSHVAEAVGVLRPSLVVLENVRGLLSAGADSDMEFCPWCLGETGDEHALRAAGAVLGDLADIGFDAEWTVVSAADAGAPHRRERVFILGWPAADADDQLLAADARGMARGQASRERRDEGPDRGSRDRDSASPENADGAARGERRVAAPGQTESGWPRADTGGPGGAHAAADACRGGRGPDERLVCEGQPDAGRRTPADADSGRFAELAELDGRAVARITGPLGDDALGRVLDWGPYGPAIARWERVLGRSAPSPTMPGKTGQRLNPVFVEWMQGLPEGWVTDVPGLSRNAMLKALGNGVVPQQAALALRLLLDRAGAAGLERAA